MTAYAPPDFTYFTGLQFNPEIYENTLVKGLNKLVGAAISIIGTISATITTPLFRVIQGATTTIEATELYTRLVSTSYTNIISPNINLSPLGTWAGVSTTLGYSQLYHPTVVYVYGPQMDINTTTTDISSRYVEFVPAAAGQSTVDLNFKTSAANDTVVSAAITCTGGTALPLAGTMEFNVRTLNNNAVIHNINSSTMSLGVSGGTISVPAVQTIETTGEIRFATTGGTYPLYTDAPIIGITNTAGGGTVTAVAWNTIQYGSTYYFSVNCTGTWSYVLPTTIRPGNMCRVMNLGTGNVNLSVAGGSARMFGDGLLRTGNVSFTIGPLKGARIECVNGTGIVAIGGNVYFIGFF